MNSKPLKDDQYSSVWRDGDWVYKRQHEFLTDNEVWCLQQMQSSGYVPEFEQMERDLIRTRFAGEMIRSGPSSMLKHVPKMLQALRRAGIRHGDITPYAVLVDEVFHPRIIDFSESRLATDPRQDKRPEGDEYWLTRTMYRIVGLCHTIDVFPNSGT